MKKYFSITLIVLLVLVSGLLAFPWTSRRFLPFLVFIEPQRLLPIYSPRSIPLHPLPDLSSYPKKLDDLVIVAHYDDEALAIGGFLASEIKAGKKVGVVVITFSEGDEISQRNWFGVKRNFLSYHWKLINYLRLLPSDITDYSQEREEETNQVLDRLGVPNLARLYLRYPEMDFDTLIQNQDQLVKGHFQNPISHKIENYSGQELSKTIQSIIQHSQPARIITHFPDDTNSGHAGVSRLVREYLSEDRKERELWYFLVHWNSKHGSWVPQEYQTETAWLQVEPQDYFVVPKGSPTNAVSHREERKVNWPQDFRTWKSKLIPLYLSQYHFDSQTLNLFAKKNELYWDLKSHTLYEYLFSP